MAERCGLHSIVAVLKCEAAAATVAEHTTCEQSSVSRNDTEPSVWDADLLELSPSNAPSRNASTRSSPMEPTRTALEAYTAGDADEAAILFDDKEAIRRQIDMVGDVS